MRSLVLAVVQSDAETDLGPALAALPGARGYVVRPPDLSGAPAPAGVGVLTVAAADRAQAAAAVRRAAAAEVIVVLEAGEQVSPELGAALVALAERAPGAYRARRLHRFLGRDVAGEMVTIAWRGAPADAAAGDLPGVVIKTEGDIATTVARLDADATRAAAERPAGGVADFAVRPLARLARLLVARRKDGVPGLILSVLESYGDMLAAAKAWERERSAAQRRAVSTARAVPVGFTSIETRSGWVVVREGTGDRLLRVLLEATPESVEGVPLVRGGRGATWALVLGDRARAVLRWYRRGGALRHLVRDRYFGWRPRPITELMLAEEARRRGVAAVEVLAARVDRLPGGFYRGAIVTREVERAETLAEVLLRRPPAGERAAVIDAVARAMCTMHDHGVHHRDLNAANILVRRDGDQVTVHLIDFDRATLGRRVPARRRRRALSRLARSLAKLDPEGSLVTLEDRAAFHRAYRGRP